MILNRIWGEQVLDLKSWAIQREPDPSSSDRAEVLARRGDVEISTSTSRSTSQRLERAMLGGAVRAERRDRAAATAGRGAAAAARDAVRRAGAVRRGRRARSSSAATREREIVTANLARARLTLLYGAERRRQELAPARRRASTHLHRAARGERGRAPAVARRSPSRLQRRGATIRSPGSMAAVRRRGSEALGGARARSVAPGEPRWSTRCRGWPSAVREGPRVLDQFEEYFLYHPDEDGDGTLRRASSPRLVNEPTLRVNFLVSIREDALAKLDRFKGRDPEPVRQLPARRAPRRDAAREAIERAARRVQPALPPASEPSRSSRSSSTRCWTRSSRHGRARRAAADGAAARRPATTRIETPYLQLVMTRLWERGATTAGRDVLAVRDARAARRRASGSSATHLDEALRPLRARAAGRSRRASFRHLVTPSGTKIAHTASRIWPTTSAAPERDRGGARARSRGGETPILRRCRRRRAGRRGALRDLPRRPRPGGARLARAADPGAAGA